MTSEDVPTTELSTQAGYDRWSASYDDYPNPLIALETPQVRRLLGDIAGLELLDVGCGTGRHSHWMASTGARVTAIDFSTGMLAQAAERDPERLVHFLQHDLHQPLPFAADSFDALVHCLVLDHLDCPQHMLDEFARVLRPGGRAVVSVMHPAMYLKGTQARFLDPESGEMVLIDNRRYSIADYVMAVRKAGLELELIEEHVGTAEIAARMPRAEKYVDWPMLLMLGLRRAPGSRNDREGALPLEVPPRRR